MKKLLTGSSILKQHFPEYREPKDIDYFVDEKGRVRNGNEEYLYNPIIFNHPMLYRDGELTLQGLFNVKLSHIRFNINWEKHMFDIQYMLENCPNDCNIDELYQKEQFEFWEEYLPKVRRSKLEQDKEEFFKNAVNEDVHQHDFLHTLIAETPAYTKLLKEGATVELDENKWHNLCNKERDEVVLEEAIVMASERFNGNIVSSYRRQLKDNIIKHYPSYIARHAILNYKQLQKPTKDSINKMGVVLKHLKKI